jgi:AAA15 family ATPase/GTPase
MIHKLSIRELDLDCRRMNVFIGEPNAEKTNIMEALWCPGVHSEL